MNAREKYYSLVWYILNTEKHYLESNEVNELRWVH